MAFLSIKGYVLQFSVCLYFANSRPSPAPPLLIPSISVLLPHKHQACSESTLVMAPTAGRERWEAAWPLRPNTGTEVPQLPGRLRSVLGSCAYGSYFRAPLMNCASAQQSQCVGAEEDCWLSEKTFQAFLCLSDAARRSAFRGTRQRGEGDGNIGLRRCRGTDYHWRERRRKTLKRERVGKLFTIGGGVY